jgi:ribosomal protein S18 acetylase RimI-like enzyme
MQKNDDVLKTAELIYGTDDFIFQFLFGKKEKAIWKLSQLVSLENNAFSYNRIIVDSERDLIRGILIENDQKHNRLETRDFLKTFGFWSLVRLFLGQILLFPILSHKQSEGRYIQNVSVDPRFRGLGIGTALVKTAIARAEEDKTTGLFLDVSKKNEGALKLYKKIGFEIVKKRRIWGLFFVTYLMKMELKK